MLRNLKDILTEQAPDLLARTKLPRKHPEYLTQKQAFDLHRKGRLEELAKNAPDLYERLRLPHGHPDHINSSRAYALYRGRKESP